VLDCTIVCSAPLTCSACDPVQVARQVVEAAVSDMHTVVLDLEAQVTQLTSDGSSRCAILVATSAL